MPSEIDASLRIKKKPLLDYLAYKLQNPRSQTEGSNPRERYNPSTIQGGDPGPDSGGDSEGGEYEGNDSGGGDSGGGEYEGGDPGNDNANLRFAAYTFLALWA